MKGFLLCCFSVALALLLVAALGWLLGEAMDNPATYILREVR